MRRPSGLRRFLTAMKHALSPIESVFSRLVSHRLDVMLSRFSFVRATNSVGPAHVAKMRSQRRLAIEGLEDRRLLAGDVLNMTTIDGNAYEPHLIYTQPSTLSELRVGSFRISGEDWPGGSIEIQVGGNAKYLLGGGPAVDYALSITSGLVPPNSISYNETTKILSMGVGQHLEGEFSFLVTLIALQEGTEPGLLDADGNTEGGSETASFSWASGQPHTGSASITIGDHAEGVLLSTVQATTSELGPPLAAR